MYLFYIFFIFFNNNKMNNLINSGFIYVLKSKDTKILDCYIGSTKDLEKRKIQHFYSCRHNSNRKLYNFINNNGGYNNWYIEVIKNIQNITRQDLKKEEKEFILKYKPTLNKNIPLQTNKEWRSKNKDRLRKNQTRFNYLYKHEYNKKRLENYRKKRDIINLCSKAYYHKNKKKINEKLNTKINCICGSSVSKAFFKEHCKRHVHKNKMININKEIIQKKNNLVNLKMSYQISARQKANAKKLNVTIKPSTNKKKKVDVFDKDNKKVGSIGAMGYKDYSIYLKELGKEKADIKKNAYLKRHSKEPKEKDGKKTNSFYADKILWS